MHGKRFKKYIQVVVAVEVVTVGTKLDNTTVKAVLLAKCEIPINRNIVPFGNRMTMDIM